MILWICAYVSLIVGYDDLDEEHQEMLADRLKDANGEVDELYQPINPDELVRKEWSVKADTPADLTGACKHHFFTILYV